MMRLLNRPLSIMVMYAIVLHACWTVILLFDATAINATAVNAIYRFIESAPLLALTLGICTCSAIVGLFTRSPIIVILLMPQQVILMMSAAGAVEAIWNSQFADGVIRDRGFIAADQLYSVIAALGHTVAIIAHGRRIGAG